MRSAEVIEVNSLINIDILLYSNLKWFIIRINEYIVLLFN